MIDPRHSFRRIAASIRKAIDRSPGVEAEFVTARQLARIFEEEASLYDQKATTAHNQ